MKYFFLILLQVILFATSSAQEKKVIYTCPMHPEVQRNSPGKCPKCGMDLVKKTITVPKKTVPPKKVNEPKPDHQKHQEEKKDPPMEVEKPKEEKHHADTTEQEFIGGKVIMQPGRTVVYHLYITDTIVNFTGKSKHAYAINGTIPGPDLVFTEGDTAEIYLHNMLKDEETSLHWHGIILPNRFDGVPYLTTAPIHPGDVHLYKFAVVQNGTYWYHSHSRLQEQAGIYGALIFKKREGQETAISAPNEVINDPHAHHEGMKMEEMQNMKKDKTESHVQGMIENLYDAEQTVVLSEWTDEKPDQVQRRLRTANDWYAIKKGSVQSYSEAVRAGHFKTKLTNEWKRMNAMDVSDVYYNHFLINGKPESENTQFKAGDRIRLRVVNAGGSSYFWLQFAGGKMTVIGNDGNDVVPVEVDRLIVGVSETYDVVVTIPDNMSYEFRATPEDRTKAASLWLGSGMKMPAPVLPRLKYFEGMKMMNDMMKMNGDMKMMDMEMSLQQMDMNMVMYDELNESAEMDHSQHMNMMEKTDSTAMMNMKEMKGMDMKSDGIVTLNYGMLSVNEKTILPDAPYKELEFTLTGNMNRYVWSINNKIAREWDKILIEKGHNVRIILFNNSMMRHPMHLHGHDFRVLNKHGEYSPLKNVLDIMPMERDTIEFAGSQSGDWFFHCHILYHMMAGMGNVFSYTNSPPNPELPDATKAYNQFLRGERMIHIMAEIGLESNGSDGMVMFATERYALKSEWHIGLKAHHGQESETYFGRYFGNMQWWFPFIGFDYHHNSKENEQSKNLLGQWNNNNNRKAFVAGVEYTLPMLIVAQARVDSKGKFRFQLERDDVPLTPRLRFNFMANTDKEYMAGFQYVIKKWLALSTHYDSEMGYGAGITIVY